MGPHIYEQTNTFIRIRLIHTIRNSPESSGNIWKYRNIKI